MSGFAYDRSKNRVGEEGLELIGLKGHGNGGTVSHKGKRKNGRDGEVKLALVLGRRER